MKPMRRNQREVKEFSEIADILKRADTVRIGINGEPYPYVVPVSFGFEASGKKITLYFHGAKEGFKHDLIRRNPNVCVEADIFHSFVETERSVTTLYESFIGFGKAELVTGKEAVRGLNLMLAHCGYPGFKYDHQVTNVVSVYKVEMESFKGKRNLTA